MTLRQRGFSLVEVMVALVVMSIGLLGIAKMQAAALSNTAIASTRSLVAIEAASLAASMHSNRGYWSTPVVAGQVILQGATVTPNVAPPLPDCIGAPCTPASLAQFDLEQWAAAARQILPPDYKATVTCSATFTPPNCTILVEWAETSVAVNDTGQKQATSALPLNLPRYELYVEP